MDNFKIHIGSTKEELIEKKNLTYLMENSPIPQSEKLDNIGLFLTRQNLAKINFIQFLYEKILPVHGVIMEFGVRWGQNMALLSALRGMLEPYNYNRKIIGFDTFEGFPAVHKLDGEEISNGDYSVTHDYISQLISILDFHNNNAPIPQKKKYELCIGDASKTLPDYLSKNQHTIIAMAYFDFDLYKPTCDCLRAIEPYLTKGSILAFDELNVEHFPGETVALKEVLGLSRYAIKKHPYNPLQSYIIID